jgi:hypothetical protein
VLVRLAREPALLDRLLPEVFDTDHVAHPGVRVLELALEHRAVPDDAELVTGLGLDRDGGDHRVLPVVGEVRAGLAHLDHDPGDALALLGGNPALRVVLLHGVQEVIDTGEVVIADGHRVLAEQLVHVVLDAGGRGLAGAGGH